MSSDQSPTSPCGLRLSLLTTYGEQCGIATYSEALVGALTQQGVTVSVLAPRLRKGDTPRADQPVRVWRRNRAGMLDAWRAFRQIRRQQADVVHVQVTLGIVSPSFLFGLAQLCARARLPLVATLHEAGGGSALRRFAFARTLWALRGAQLIVHESDPDVAAAHVIPHGIAAIPLRPRAEARRLLGLELDDLVLAHFGFIHPDKGIENVLQVVAKLRDSRFPNLKYRVCGGTFASQSSTAHLAHLRSVVRAAHLESTVDLTGQFASEERVTLEMQSADLVLLNYRTGNRQGASGAAHRALANGCALVVTRAPIFDGLREAAHTLTGPLRDELQALLQSPEQRAQIAARAEAFCEARRWPRVAASHAELYRNALAQIHPRSPNSG
jgi:glycosyltransferase involved in cell wall biosynthesis